MIGTLLYYFSLAYNAVTEISASAYKHINVIGERTQRAIRAFNDTQSIWILPATGINCLRMKDIATTDLPLIEGYSYDPVSSSFYRMNAPRKDVNDRSSLGSLPYIGGEISVYRNDIKTTYDLTDWMGEQRWYGGLAGSGPSPEQIMLAWGIYTNRLGLLANKLKLTLIDLMGDDVVMEW